MDWHIRRIQRAFWKELDFYTNLEPVISKIIKRDEMSMYVDKMVPCVSLTTLMDRVNKKEEEHG